MIIEIITSSNDEIKETGFGSILACGNMLKSVRKMGHSVKITVCRSLDDLDAVLMRKPDMVVLAAKYMSIENGDNVWFSEYFNNNNIIFSGSTRETLKYDSNKISAKLRLENLGIKTAKYFTATPGQHLSVDELPLSFPLFLKPVDAANGNGIDGLSYVNTFIEFEAKVLSLYDLYKQPVLVEEYLGGREFTVAIIKTAKGDMSVSAIEIVPPESVGGLRILGATVKREDTEKLKKIEISNISGVKDLAIAAFIGLGVRGFGRIDVKMDSCGQCFFMEANLVPGMNYGTSYFPQACKIANEISYDEVVSLMLDESLARTAACKNNTVFEIKS